MADDALHNAELYLQPILKREDFIPAKRASVVDRLFESSDETSKAGQTRQEIVVDRGLALLESIHHAIRDDPASAATVLNTSSSRRLIDALLDLISLEGIYPQLLPGVGCPIERRVRSVLQGSITITDTKAITELDSRKLSHIAQHLYDLVISQGGVASAIQQRTLVDVIAAMAQLVHSPDHSCTSQWSDKLSRLIDSSSPSTLFPSLISLLHSTTPGWLKPFVTVSISLLPMRPEGVRQTITFVANSTPQRPTQSIEQPQGSDKGPILPTEVLAQIAKVLSAVPSTISPETYFKRISPQMMHLLTDRDPDAQRAAAYTISHGILNKRQFGQVGAVGWQYFAEPLISAIKNPRSNAASTGLPLSQRTEAIKKLSTLIFAFPNPALSKRILTPIILSLWAISCLPSDKSMETDLAMKLLEHYINSVAGSKGLLTIVDGLLYTGDTDQTFQSDPKVDSGITYIDIKSSNANGSDRLSRVHQIRPRIDRFMQLLDACQDDAEIGSFFARILQRTLKTDVSGLDSQNKDILQPVIDANIAKEVISTRSSRMMDNIAGIMSVIEEVLTNQVDAVQMIQASQDSTISRFTMATIVNPLGETEKSVSGQDLEDTLAVCLPWLILIAQSDSDGLHQVNQKDSHSLLSLLGTIASIPKVSRTSKDTIRLIFNLYTGAKGASDGLTDGYAYRHTKDVELYTSAMKNLTAAEPPIRVQGLSQLEALVACNSSLTSTSAATLTITSLLQDGDSFVYLSAIKVLTVIARKDPAPVVKTLQEAYQDVTEQSTIDVRLRIGEALQTILEEIGPHLPSVSSENLVELLLFLSSRRVYRPKTLQAQQRASFIPRVVAGPDEEDNSDDDPEDVNRKSEQELQSILDFWQGESGSEDLRIRTSALTILATAFENADFSIISPFIPSSIEVITQILRLESGQENAIIRRAAVLAILSMIKGQQNHTQERGSSLMNPGCGERESSVDGITTLLETVAVEDDDAIVRGHAENVLEAIQDWRRDVLDGFMRGDGIRTGLEDGTGNIRLRGLDVDPTLQSERHGIEEVE